MKKTFIATLTFAACLTFVSCGSDDAPTSDKDTPVENATPGTDDATNPNPDAMNTPAGDTADVATDPVADGEEDPTADAGANEWDAKLDEYEAMVDDYLEASEKAMAPGASLEDVEEFTGLSQSAGKLNSELAEAPLSDEQYKRLQKLQEKFAEGSLGN